MYKLLVVENPQSAVTELLKSPHLTQSYLDHIFSSILFILTLTEGLNYNEMIVCIK